MWGRKRSAGKHPDSEVECRPGGIGDECDAFLAGAYVQYLREHDMPIPVHAWLNRVAHSRSVVLGALAVGPTRAEGRLLTWQSFEREAARLVIATAAPPDAGGVRAVQRDRLVPLELRLMAGELTPPATPAQLLQLVQAVVNRHPSAG